ncbi:lysozyme [Novosphingobium lentum]|uniref:lysozyme n=1 Tax=Novosphingobium lentum TaxID=145287 RepID=UPI00082F25CB|nr:hypothetical protein [Novosphingobium lentum]
MRDITPRIAIELIAHEGIVREAYRDGGGVWTWSVGITDASGHAVVPRYKDNPQSLAHCLGVFLWLLRTRYLPQVLAAFGAHALTEAELGAALSFHWNTGAIGRATWVQQVVAGDSTAARRAMLQWARPAALLPRREREAALFFDRRWSGATTALVYDVAKPGYTPCRPARVEIADTIDAVFDTGDAQPGPPAATPSAPSPPAAPAAAPPAATGGRPGNWFDRLFG